MHTFIPHQNYTMTSICDHDCRWYYQVVKRTPKTVTLQEIEDDGSSVGDTINCRISVWNGSEEVRPLGNYSLSPTLRAWNIATLATPEQLEARATYKRLNDQLEEHDCVISDIYQAFYGSNYEERIQSYKVEVNYFGLWMRRSAALRAIRDTA